MITIRFVNRVILAFAECPINQGTLTDGEALAQLSSSLRSLVLKKKDYSGSLK